MASAIAEHELDGTVPTRALERLAGGLPTHRDRPIDGQHRRHAGRSTSRSSRCWCGGSMRPARAWRRWPSGWPARSIALPDARTDCSAGRAGIAVGLVPPRKGGPSPRATIVDGRVARASSPAGFDGDVLAGRLGDPAGHCGVLVFLAPAGPRLRPRTRRVGPTAAWSRSRWPWRTTCGCGRWPPCARPPRPTSDRS